MLSVLAHPVYRRLLGAQVVALLGTGLLTVALGLLAYDLAGEAAGAVLGTRLAYDLESLVSPMLAAALLTVVGFHDLFAGTVAGFLVSAALVAGVALPAPRPALRRGVWDRTTRGARLYLAVPRLRGLLALNLAAAAGGAMVIVNTVVLVKGMGWGEREVALALAAFGGGSMLAALGLPRLLDRWGDRRAMLGGAGLLTAGLAAGAAAPGYGALLALWAVVGLGYSAILTPSGRLLRRSSGAEDRPALFAAQFALSHAGWLVAYPLAGQLGARIGLGATAAAMAALAAGATLLAVRLWPAGAEAPLPHDHPDLPPDHPHLREHGAGPRHAHPPLADPLHPGWARAA